MSSRSASAIGKPRDSSFLRRLSILGVGEDEGGEGEDEGLMRGKGEDEGGEDDAKPI